MRNAALPIMLIVVGILGLVWYFGWIPDFDAMTSIGFIAGGVLVLVMDGITKSSVVLGPTLMAIGVAWWVHDQQQVRLRLLVPVLLIVSRPADAGGPQPAYPGATPASPVVLNGRTAEEAP